MSSRTPVSTSPIQSIRHIAGDIKIAHSVFALPFALLAAFMAASGATGLKDGERFGFGLLLVVVAMVCARSAAMLANRLLDRKIDAHQPTDSLASDPQRTTPTADMPSWRLGSVAESSCSHAWDFSGCSTMHGQSFLAYLSCCGSACTHWPNDSPSCAMPGLVLHWP